jgi:hypothetical protein
VTLFELRRAARVARLRAEAEATCYLVVVAGVLEQSKDNPLQPVRFRLTVTNHGPGYALDLDYGLEVDGKSQTVEHGLVARPGYPYTFDCDADIAKLPLFAEFDHNRLKGWTRWTDTAGRRWEAERTGRNPQITRRIEQQESPKAG